MLRYRSGIPKSGHGYVTAFSLIFASFIRGLFGSTL
jgi:hypothetical protein